MEGQTVSHYRILEKIGQGGMGEVYLAEDTSLERKVALKFLPTGLQADPVAHKRFIREAKSAAAIEHPFICNIKEVAQTEDGQDFIVMEYVEGETLKDKLDKGRIPIKEALQIGSEVSQALERAHSAGVIHRDLKPTNIMLTLDGHPKVMDFGLAKRIARDKEDLTSVLTREGTTLGTLAYMSPEQLRGSTVDTKSDVFSLGVVLYEMLTGLHPFSTGTQAETVNAILSEHPSTLSRYVQGVPDLLQHTLEKMLAKQPGERYQTVHEIRTNLTKVMEEITSPTPLAGPQKRSVRWIGTAALLILGIALLAAWWYFTSQAPEGPMEPLRTIPFTSELGREYHPSFSPDGESIAYVQAVGNRKTEIRVRLVGDQHFNSLTQGVGEDLHPVWSPDGKQIAFYRSNGEDIGIFIVGSLGGEARRLLPLKGAGNGLSWHGDLLAFCERDTPDQPFHISLFSKTRGEKQKLTSPTLQTGADQWPRFSPDGTHLAFRRGRWMVQNIFIIPIPNGHPKPLTENAGQVDGLAWTTDGEEIVFSSMKEASPGLWRVSTSRRSPRRLGTVGDGAIYPAIRGNRLAYTERTWRTDILKLELKDGKADGPPVSLIASTLADEQPHISPDGKKIVFASTRDGKLRIWVCKDDGSNPVPLTLTNLDSTDVSGPCWSPDGQRIAFTSLTPEGGYDIYVIDSEGGLAQRLTTEPLSDTHPRWSRDGQWIYFRSERSGRNEVWKVVAEGGEPKQVTTNGGINVEESFDREHLYYVKGREKTLWSRPIAGGEETLIMEDVSARYWCLGERGIYVLYRDSKPLPSIRLFDLQSLEWTLVAELSKDAEDFAGGGRHISVSPGDEWLVYQVATYEEDIMLVENFQ